MSDGPAPPRQIFGIGAVIGETLWVFVRRIHWALIGCLPGLVLGGLLTSLAVWVFATERVIRMSYRSEEYIVLGCFAICVGGAIGVMAGPLSRLVEDARLSRNVRIGVVLRTVLYRPVESVICGVLTVSATLIPIVLFMLGGYSSGFIIQILGALLGTWVLAHIGICLPVVHIDRLGFGALARASSLGRGYRLTIGGTFFVMLAIAFVLGGGLTGLLAVAMQFLFSEVIGFSSFPHPWRMLIPLFYLGLVTFLVVGFMATGAAVIRARMVEIKEPLDITPLVDLFD